MENAAALLSWLGASLVVVSDGRRGLATGVALATTGLALLTFDTAGVVAAVAIALGGVVASVRRFASGPDAWGILPPGSTPRLVLCLAAAILAFWFAAGASSEPGAPIRFTAMLVIGLTGARVLGSPEPPVLLTAAGLLALGIGAAATLGPGSSATWACLAGGLIAVAVVVLPARSASAA